MLLEWRRHGVLTAAGYILGFPSDTPESVARDIAIIQKELPIDVLEFFVLTPLPGSEDHKKLYLAGADLETDLNRYDLEHVCGDHPKMGRETWQRVYRDAWLQYYSDEHVETIMRRGIASGIRSRRKLFDDILLFSGATRIRKRSPASVWRAAPKGSKSAPFWTDSRTPHSVLCKTQHRNRANAGPLASAL